MPLLGLMRLSRELANHEALAVVPYSSRTERWSLTRRKESWRQLITFRRIGPR
jgi:hypothetical protein